MSSVILPTRLTFDHSEPDENHDDVRVLDIKRVVLVETDDFTGLKDWVTQISHDFNLGSLSKHARVKSSVGLRSMGAAGKSAFDPSPFRWWLMSGMPPSLDRR